MALALLKPSQLHMETQHPEGGDSPFIVKDDASIAALLAFGDSATSEDYASCPVDGCGEAILFTELDSHIEMHAEEQESDDDKSSLDRQAKKLKLDPEVEASFDTKLSRALRNIGDEDDVPREEAPRSEKQASAKAAWKGLLKMPTTSPKASVAAPVSGKPRRRLGVCLSSCGFRIT
jgi:hypothetical protein